MCNMKPPGGLQSLHRECQISNVLRDYPPKLLTGATEKFKQ